MIRNGCSHGLLKRSFGVLAPALLVLVVVAVPRLAYANDWAGGNKGTTSTPWPTIGTRQSIVTQSTYDAPSSGGDFAWVAEELEGSTGQNIIQIGYHAGGSGTGTWPTPTYFYELMSDATGYGEYPPVYFGTPTLGTSYLYQMAEENVNGVNCWVGRIGGTMYVHTGVSNIFTPNHTGNLSEISDISYDFFFGDSLVPVDWNGYGFMDSKGWHGGLLNWYSTNDEGYSSCSTSGSSSWITYDTDE